MKNQITVIDGFGYKLAFDDAARSLPKRGERFQLHGMIFKSISDPVVSREQLRIPDASEPETIQAATVVAQPSYCDLSIDGPACPRQSRYEGAPIAKGESFTADG